MVLRFKEEDAKKIIRIIERDVLLLRKHNLMDYSILMAIEKTPFCDQAIEQAMSGGRSLSDDSKHNNSLGVSTKLIPISRNPSSFQSNYRKMVIQKASEC